MAAIIISGIPPWDGRYELNDFSFTNRELFEIKKLSGIRAGELWEALEAGDTAAFVGVAAVAMARNGKVVDPDDLWGGELGSISLDFGDQEGAPADADPPSPIVGASERSDSTDSSGGGSSDDGA